MINEVAGDKHRTTSLQKHVHTHIDSHDTSISALTYVVVFPLDYKPIAPPKIGTAWVIVIAVALGYELDGGMVGLILSYSAVMTGLLNWGVRRSVYLLRLYIYT